MHIRVISSLLLGVFLLKEDQKIWYDLDKIRVSQLNEILIYSIYFMYTHSVMCVCV